MLNRRQRKQWQEHLFLAVFIAILYLLGYTTVFSQVGSYSTLAQKKLDDYATANPNTPNNLDVFKFSIKEILDANDTVVLGANNKPELYGQTDYESEFTLANDLNTSFKIEIPAFVIDALAEDANGEYYPVIINGANDEEDGNYVNSFRDNDLAADINQTYNESGPGIIERNYDTGRKETQYLWDDGTNVFTNTYDNQTKSWYYNNDVFEVFKFEGTGGYTYTNHNDITNVSSAYEYVNTDGKTGYIYTGPDDANEKYEQYAYSNGSSGLKYTESGLEIKQDVTTGNDVSVVNITSSVGTYAEIAEIITPAGMSHIEFHSNQLPAIQNTDGTYGNHVFQLTNTTNSAGVVEKTFTNGTNKIVKTTDAGLTTIKYNDQLLIANLESIVDAAPRIVKKDALIQTGNDLITSGGLTLTAANNFFNSNSPAIDFKDQYDTINGEAIVPEKGYVKFIDGEPGQYINLASGDVVEFFVNPSATYLNNHKADNPFYIDRPLPSAETDTDTTTDNTDTNTTPDSQTDDENSETIISSPEATDETTTIEINLVTTVYVQAPASNFSPTTIVVPVQSDGDYVSNILPGPAESFPKNIEVVAVPPEEAKRIEKKVEELKKAEAEKNKYKRANERPVVDDALIPEKEQEKLLKSVQKAPQILVNNSKQILFDEFPNLSKEFIDFLFASLNRKDRFKLMLDPPKYVEEEFAKLDALLSSDLSLPLKLERKDLIKINNILNIKFSNDLANAGLPQSKNKKIIFVNNVIDLSNLIQKHSLQNELLPLISMIFPKLSEKGKIEFGESLPEFKKDGSSDLFERNSSKETISKIKFFASLIDTINDPYLMETRSPFSNNTQDLPLVEINVREDQNIKEALKEEMTTIKSLNRPYQTNSFKETLDKFDFNIPDEELPTNIGVTNQVTPEPIEIPQRQLQLMAEATEAADNLLIETVDKMIEELGFEAGPKDSKLISPALFSQANDISDQSIVSNLLQITEERVKAVEDIRAIFQSMGLGS